MIKIIVGRDFIETVRGKFILLDTNIFIDSSTTTFKEHLVDFLQHKIEATLFTIDTVYLEFVKGSQDDQVFLNRESFLKQFVDNNIVPLTTQVQQDMVDIIKNMKQGGAKASYVDISLGAFIKQYSEKQNTLLLTKNVTDFPLNIYDLKSSFTIFHNSTAHTYGLYSFRK